jgi:hypothetical protein
MNYYTLENIDMEVLLIFEHIIHLDYYSCIEARNGSIKSVVLSYPTNRFGNNTYDLLLSFNI